MAGGNQPDQSSQESIEHLGPLQIASKELHAQIEEEKKQQAEVTMVTTEEKLKLKKSELRATSCSLYGLENLRISEYEHLIDRGDARVIAGDGSDDEKTALDLAPNQSNLSMNSGANHRWSDFLLVLLWCTSVLHNANPILFVAMGLGIFLWDVFVSTHQWSLLTALVIPRRFLLQAAAPSLLWWLNYFNGISLPDLFHVLVIYDSIFKHQPV